jgi:hypothetical protein
MTTKTAQPQQPVRIGYVRVSSVDQNTGRPQLQAMLACNWPVGSVQPAEASGIDSALQGLRQTIEDDDPLLATASTVFDGLLFTFQQSEKAL